MQSDIKISIIIPVYNTELYLRDCLRSVVKQTLKEIEIIIVNDGSTDRSFEIIKEFAYTDARFRVIDKKNEGQGIARNIALNDVRGQYIGFVDSDDRIDENMFLELYTCAKKADADISICSFDVLDDDKGRTTRPSWSGIPFPAEYDNRTFNWQEAGDWIFQIAPSPFNKIYRTTFVERIQAKFAERSIYEDLLFVFTCLLNAQKINYTRKSLYTYRYLRNRSSSADSGMRHFQIFSVLDQLKDKLTEAHVYHNVSKDFHVFQFTQYYYHFQLIDQTYKNDFWKRLRSEFERLDTSQKVLIRKRILPLKLGLMFGTGIMKVYHKMALMYSRVKENK